LDRSLGTGTDLGKHVVSKHTVISLKGPNPDREPIFLKNTIKRLDLERMPLLIIVFLQDLVQRVQITKIGRVHVHDLEEQTPLCQAS
jgi:hypothetical protein